MEQENNEQIEKNDEDKIIKFTEEMLNDDEIYEKVDHQGIRFFLDKINSEEYLIPSFQREFVWNKDRVISLLTSLFRGYPIGSLLLCPINTETKRFYKPKTFNYEMRNNSGGYIVLDGQQRLTALFRAFSKSYKTLKENSDDKYYFYYLRIKFCNLESQRLIKEEIELTIEATTVRYNEVRDGDAYMLPLNIMYDNDDENFNDWISRFEKDYSKRTGLDRNIVYRDAISLFSATSSKGIFSRLFNKDLIPYIILSSSTSKNIERVCDMFDKLNDTGLTLDDFDKISSKLYPKKIDLRKIWYDSIAKYEMCKKYKIEPIEIIRLMSLIDQKENGQESFSAQLKYIKNYMMGFNDEEILKSNFNKACKTMNEALVHLKNNQGLVSRKWIPRSPVLIVFAVGWHFIQKNDRRIRSNLIKKIERWYWCNNLSKNFDGSTITPLAEETKSLLNWFDNEKEVPDSVKKFRMASDLKDIYKTNAQYKSIMCILVKNGIIDFYEGKKVADYSGDNLDDHHIFPVDYLTKSLDLYELKKINCVLNRTLVHKSTNRSKYIGNIAPVKYLSEIKQNLNKNKFDELCESHILDSNLNSNIYKSFTKLMKYREQKLKALIDSLTR